MTLCEVGVSDTVRWMSVTLCEVGVSDADCVRWVVRRRTSFMFILLDMLVSLYTSGPCVVVWLWAVTLTLLFCLLACCQQDIF